MAGRILLLVAALSLGVLGWLATRSGGLGKRGLEAPPSEPEAATRPEPEARLPSASRVEGAAREEESGPLTQGEPGASQAPREALVRARLVTLYQHATHDPNFPGYSWKLALGLTDAGYVFADDDASALDVPDGLRVTLYADKGGSGARLTLGPGRHNLAPHGFNDLVSSARVESLAAEEGAGAPTLALYRDVPPEGDPRPGDWNLALPPDRSKFLFTVANGDFEAGSLSALRIPPGHEALLFVQPDGRGLNLALGPGYHELAPAGFDERVASIRFSRATKR